MAWRGFSVRRPSTVEGAARQGGEQTRSWLASAGAISPFVIATAAAVLFALGLVVNVSVRSKGFNDFAWPWLLSRMILTGDAAYDPGTLHAASHAYFGKDLIEGLQPYPPATGVAVLPLGVLPWGVACVLYFGLAYVALVSGLWTCLRTFCPSLSACWRLLATAFVTCMACTRWAFTSYQIGPLVVWAGCHYAVALKTGRYKAALSWGLLGMSLKVTLGLPFIGVAFALRRYRWALAMALLFAVINFVGFARVGGISAVEQWLDTVRYQTSTALIVDTPDPHAPGAPSRIDAEFLLNALTSAHRFNQILALLVTLGVAGWLLRSSVRQQRMSHDVVIRLYTAAFTPLGLFAVYHHHYDTIVLLVPVALLLATDLGPSAQRWKCLYVASASAYSTFYAPMFADWALDHFGPAVAVFSKSLGAASVAVTLFSALRIISLVSRQPAGLSTR
jgi:hypothetical protein